MLSVLTLMLYDVVPAKRALWPIGQCCLNLQISASKIFS